MTGARMLPEKELDLEVQATYELLVTPVGTWRHVVLPIDDLVPHPIVWEEDEVFVREPAVARFRAFHAHPLRAVIVHRPSRYDDGCERDAGQKRQSLEESVAERGSYRRVEHARSWQEPIC